MRVFVTGGTGLIGRHLVSGLLDRGDSVTVLTRNAAAARRLLPDVVPLVEGDPVLPGPWQESVCAADAVVHLAGEPIFARRWTAAAKERIRSSRITSTRNVVAAIRQCQSRPTALVSGSAVGYYGPRDDEELSEDAPAGSDFLARLCIDWEAEALQAQTDTRVVLLRTGVVLARDGGALQQMSLPFRLHLGGPVATGRQWISWIHVRDLVGLIVFALRNENVVGPLNATAPAPETNRDFSRVLAQVLGRKSWLPAPRLALRIALGEVADVVCKGQRVLPAKALRAGYPFQYPSLPEALREIASA